MSINPTAKPLHVEIGGHQATIHFDLNTLCAFEEATGRFFLDFLTSLQPLTLEAAQDAASNTGPPDSPQAAFALEKTAVEILRKIGMRDVRALIWAGWHTYDGGDEPVWPFTISQVGAMLDAGALVRLLPQILHHSIANSVDKEESEKVRPTHGEGTIPLSHSPRNSGGGTYGPSDESILNSMTPKSAALPSSGSPPSVSRNSKKTSHA